MDKDLKKFIEGYERVTEMMSKEGRYVLSDLMEKAKCIIKIQDEALFNNEGISVQKCSLKALRSKIASTIKENQ